jgi:hypothetical protein
MRTDYEYGTNHRFIGNIYSPTLPKRESLRHWLCFRKLSFGAGQHLNTHDAGDVNDSPAASLDLMF